MISNSQLIPSVPYTPFSLIYFENTILSYLQYHGLSSTSSEVQWFWHLVQDLKEEERALLLKFTTGCPSVPAGGFSCLRVGTAMFIERNSTVSLSTPTGPWRTNVIYCVSHAWNGQGKYYKSSVALPPAPIASSTGCRCSFLVIHAGFSVKLYIDTKPNE